MNRKMPAEMILAALSVLLATACAPIQVATRVAPAAPQTVASSNPVAASANPVAATPTTRVASAGPASANAAATPAVPISLSDQTTLEGAGVIVTGNTIAITAGGAYRLSGIMQDGQVVVAAKNSESVQLILDGAGITSSTDAPIYVKSAKAASIVLADGSANYLVDGASRSVSASGADEANAALDSAVDLTVSGNGSLAVEGRYNDGIASKDDLSITGGNIAVTSVADGIRGRDRLDIAGGTIAVNAGKDGLKSSNDEDADKGVVAISAGDIQVTSREDGIQAETTVAISGGAIAITAGGGSTVSPTDDVSAKGIKGAANVTIDGGSITVDAADDAVHSNGSLAIRGGTLVVASADDGLLADAQLEIAGGDITVTNSNEGIESANITIADGRIRIRSRDDGLNAAGGSDGSAVGVWPARPGSGAASNSHLTISGGYLVIDSETDGIDVNGSIDMTGGVAIVHGPTAQHDGAIDYDGTFTLSGGSLIAAGSAGMAQAPSSVSTQPSVMITFPTAQAAGTVVHIGAQSGEELLTFAPLKAYQTLVVSSPRLESGASYVVHTGGSSTGALADGLHSNGVYTAGAQVTTFTVAGIVTNAGSGNVGVQRGGGPRR